MERKRYTYNRVNCLLSSIIIFAMVIYIGSFIRQTFSLNFIKRGQQISSFGLFLTYMLLLTTNSQFIAFNEFSATGKCPAVYFYVSIILSVIYFGMFIVSVAALWFTADILNKWNQQTKSIFIAVCILNGLVFIKI